MIYIRRISGHSMLPRFLPGRLVVAIRPVRSPKTGQVVIIGHQGKEKIKRIERLDGDKVYVLGDHPEASTDSRHFGWLRAADIKALVIWPR